MTATGWPRKWSGSARSSPTETGAACAAVTATSATPRDRRAPLIVLPPLSSTPPTPPAASLATVCAPARCPSRSSASAPSRSCRRSESGSHSASPDCVVDHQENHSSDDGHDETVDVQPGDPLHAEQVEQPASDHSADDPQGDVQEEPFARLVDQLAADEPRDQAEYNPRDDRHWSVLPILVRVMALLDDLVRPPQHRLRDRQAERLGGLEVDDQLELGRLLDG